MKNYKDNYQIISDLYKVEKAMVDNYNIDNLTIIQNNCVHPEYIIELLEINCGRNNKNLEDCYLEEMQKIINEIINHIKHLINGDYDGFECDRLIPPDHILLECLNNAYDIRSPHLLNNDDFAIIINNDQIIVNNEKVSHCFSNIKVSDILNLPAVPKNCKKIIFKPENKEDIYYDIEI